MGTINYKTSDYITLAVKPYDPDEIRDALIDAAWYYDAETIQAEDVSSAEVYNYIDERYHDDFENAKAIIEKYGLYYYHVTVEPGYYEGIQVLIENNFGVAYNDYQEKREAQKEITKIKTMLLELNDTGFNACGPGWCTTFYTRDETIPMILEAVKEMREEAKATPTWSRYTA